MELPFDEIEKYIEQICASMKIVDIDDEYVVFKYPSSKQLVKARHIYESEYSRALKDGLLSNDDMSKLIESRNLITDKERSQLKSLESKLEAQKILLAKTTKVKANQDRIKSVIHDLENQIYEIKSKEKSKFSMTAETRAEESKLLFLCWSCTYNYTTDELYWNSYTLFLNSEDLLFRQKVISEFILFYSGIQTPHIRAIARSNLWRIRYVTSVKTSEPLFGVPTSEYSNDMLNLVYWSHYYQNIYEMMPEDQPSDDIIEDDEALDAYLKDYYDERTRDAATRKDRRKLGKTKLSAFDKDEVIVTRANELYEDINYDTPREAQAVQDRNLIRKKSKFTRNKNRINRSPDKLPTK